MEDKGKLSKSKKPKIQGCQVLDIPKTPFERELLCVGCGWVPYPNCFVCPKGHNWCQECFFESAEAETAISKEEGEEEDKEENCCDPGKLTMQEHSKPFIKLLNESIWNCKYKENGCEAELTFSELFTHVLDCENSPEVSWPCRAFGCKQRLKKNDLDSVIPHYWGEHEVVPVTIKKGGYSPLASSRCTIEVPIYDDEAVPRIKVIREDSTERHFILCFHSVDGQVHIWLWDQELGPASEVPETFKIIQESYRITLMPKTLEYVDGSLSYRGTCQDIERSNQAIMEAGDCMIVGLEQLKKKYMRTTKCEDGDYQYYVINLSILRNEPKSFVKTVPSLAMKSSDAYGMY